MQQRWKVLLTHAHIDHSGLLPLLVEGRNESVISPFDCYRLANILGAASIQVLQGGRSVHFSGDLGRSNDLLLRPPAPPEAADYLAVESTYGDRNHSSQNPIETLASSRW